MLTGTGAWGRPMCALCDAMTPDGGTCTGCGEWFRTFVDFADHAYAVHQESDGVDFDARYAAWLSGD